MTLNQLYCFVNAAEYLSFSEAARQMNLAQSAVSYHIAELEKELGVKLFVRNPKNIELTSEGNVLLEKAYTVLSITNEAPLLVKKAASGTTGQIKIGVPFAPLLDRYVDLLRLFKQKYPEIEITINAYSSTEISRLLENNQLDIGFTRYPFLYNKSQFNWEPLYTDVLYVVTNKNHPLHRKKEVDIIEFENDTLLLNQRRCDPGWYDLVMNACVRNQFSPIVDDQYTDLFVVLMMVEMGVGITVLPECWRRHVNSDLCFLQIRDSGKDRAEAIGAAWNKNQNNNSVRLLLEEFGIQIN